LFVSSISAAIPFLFPSPLQTMVYDFAMIFAQVAKRHDLPLILHTRKAEERVLEMLIEEGITKADFHCFCGKVKLGRRIAEAGTMIDYGHLPAQDEVCRTH
jgi:Tat protein secretion system quality control protein TatD with DNase activity